MCVTWCRQNIVVAQWIEGGAQSGAGQNIQKLQEVNGEADLLGRPFVKDKLYLYMSLNLLFLQFIFGFSFAWFLQAVCLCLPLDWTGGEIAESVNLSEYSTGRK